MQPKNQINSQIQALTALVSSNQGVKKLPSLLEKKFQHHHYKRNFYACRLTLWLGLFIFSAGGVFIILFFPKWGVPFFVSIGIVTPILLLLIFLCYTPLYIHFQQLIVCCAALVILFGLSIIAALAPMPMKDLVYQGMLLPPLFVSTLASLQFRYMVLIMIALMLFSNISYHFSEFLALHNYYSFWVNNYLLLGGSSLTLVASYFNEGYFRMQFLLGQLVQLKSDSLEYLSNYDALTEVPNRRFFSTQLDKEWRRARREKQHLALIFLDFDYFKQYNDKYGHLLGDRALASIAHAIQTCLRRPSDFAARYGGDEFVILLPNTSLAGAIDMAKKIQSEIEDLHLEHADSKISAFITTTYGIAEIAADSDSNPQLLIKQADIALNEGKKTKRNEIYIYKKEEPSTVSI